uniref:Uncharacterized protein n=1 Tax=Cyclophora tenuis TaxID=216820 RepID=A0A7S1CWY4_CYCTE|mmetsp:Transcript_12836/g.21809  ORF Transcript_12836/g.21809 Transcript_12836/m.21809 type:complete len:351 (+) Transcript_12836:1-1053(+)
MKFMKLYGTDHRTLVCYSLLHHLRAPLRTALPSLLEGYRLATEQGDDRCAGHACTLYTNACYYSGMPLGEVAADLNSFLGKIGKQNYMWNSLVLQSRYVAKLMGNCEGLPNIENCVKESEESLISRLQESKSEFVMGLFYYQSMMISFHFDFMELAVLRGEKAWDQPDVEGSTTYICTYNLFSALTALEASKKTKRSKHYMRIFKKFQEKLLKWFHQGYSNCQHMVELLLAEEMGLQRRQRSAQVIKGFDRAIATATKLGCIQDAAFGTERAGLFLRRRKREKAAAVYLERARQMYATWGAKAKVAHLERKYYQMLTPSRLQNLSMLEHLERTSTPRLSSRRRRSSAHSA